VLHRSRLGQGLSINTIIIAALGIIALVILVVILQQRTALFGTGLREVGKSTCEPVGEPKPIGTDCPVIYGTFTDIESYQICCRKEA